VRDTSHHILNTILQNIYFLRNKSTLNGSLQKSVAFFVFILPSSLPMQSIKWMKYSQRAKQNRRRSQNNPTWTYQIDTHALILVFV